MARTDVPICTAVSASTTSTASVRRREASAWVRATPRLATTCLMAASCSCEAPAASLAPLAICSMARRSSSAAAAASVRPLASSSVAAARRSETLSCGRADTRRAAPFCWPLRAGGRVRRAGRGADRRFARRRGGADGQLGLLDEGHWVPWDNADCSRWDAVARISAAGCRDPSGIRGPLQGRCPA